MFITHLESVHWQLRLRLRLRLQGIFISRAAGNCQWGITWWEGFKFDALRPGHICSNYVCVKASAAGIGKGRRVGRYSMLGQLWVSHKRVRHSSIFANLLLRFFISFSFRFINFTFTHKYVNNLLTLRSTRAALRALLCSTLAAPGALSIFVFISGITNLRRAGHFCCID